MGIHFFFFFTSLVFSPPIPSVLANTDTKDLGFSLSLDMRFVKRKASCKVFPSFWCVNPFFDLSMFRFIWFCCVRKVMPSVKSDFLLSPAVESADQHLYPTQHVNGSRIT